MLKLIKTILTNLSPSHHLDNHHSKVANERSEALKSIKVVAIGSYGMHRRNGIVASMGLKVPDELWTILGHAEFTEILERNGIVTINNKFNGITPNDPSQWIVYKPRMLKIEIDMNQAGMITLKNQHDYNIMFHGRKKG